MAMTPFDLVIENQYKNQATPVLYIVSFPREEDDSQNIRFRFVNRSGQDISLYPKTSLSEDSFAENYHFALVFRPSTIHYKDIEENIAGVRTVVKKGTKVIQEKFSLALAESNLGAWQVSDPVKQADSTEIIYFTYTGPDIFHIAATDEITFLVKGLSAAAATGSRSTQVQLHYREPVSDNFVTWVRNQHLDVINHDGKTFAPLDFLVLGAPTLVHRSQDNTIRLQMVETKGREIFVSENTAIVFKFPFYKGNYDPNMHPAWVFGKNDAVNMIAYQKDKDETTNLIVDSTADDISYSHWGYRCLQYKFTSKGEINQLILQFTGVPADGPIGDARISISIHNLPGYWDTDFEVKLDKTLLSTQYYENKDLKIARDYGMLSGQVVVGQDLATKDGWDISGSLNSSLSITSANIEDNNENENFQLFVTRLLRLHDQKVGMNGLDISVANAAKDENTDSKKLPDYITPFLIKADQYNKGIMFHVDPFGKVWANGNIVTEGAVWAKGNVNTEGDIVAKGRVLDKTGEVMPVGAIIAYGGSAPPTGWLLCNGTSLLQDAKYNDLKNIVGSLTPDLRDRFIIGAGGGYNLGATGGEKAVTLNEAQMQLSQYKMNEVTRHADWSHKVVMIPSGGGQAHDNMPPYYALTYIIKY